MFREVKIGFVTCVLEIEVVQSRRSVADIAHVAGDCVVFARGVVEGVKGLRDRVRAGTKAIASFGGLGRRLIPLSFDLGRDRPGGCVGQRN